MTDNHHRADKSFALNAKMATGTDRARDLAMFALVVECGSFSSAGRVLELSPSAVSRAIDRIEARLGIRLLLRSTRTLSVTAEGQAYLHAARRILIDLDDAEQQISNQGAPSGRLRVSGAQSHGRLHLVPLLAEFSGLYPRILIDLSLTDKLVDIAAGEADVAIRFGPLADSPLSARKVGESPRVVVASPDYLTHAGTPRTPQDLLAHNCLNISFRRSVSDWPFRINGEDVLVEVKGSVETDSGEILKELALAGLGIARLATFEVAADVEAGRLIPILEDFNPGDLEQIHAVFFGGPNTPTRVRVFVDFIVSRVRDLT